jgi:hypothetical protein
LIADSLPLIGNFFSNLGSNISDFVENSLLIQSIGTIVTELFNVIKELGVGIGEVFSEIFSNFGQVSSAGNILAKAFDVAFTGLNSAIQIVILTIRNFKDIIVGAFDVITLQVKTFVNFWSAIFRGDFKGAVNVIGDYIKGLTGIFENTFGKIKNNIIDFVKGILKIIEPFASAFNIDVKGLDKTLDSYKTKVAKTAKEVQKSQKNLSVEATATVNQNVNTVETKQTKEGKASSNKKDDSRKKELEAEKKYNEEIIKQRVEAEKQLGLELEQARKEFTLLQDSGAEALVLEKKKQELRAIEEKYLNDLLVLQSQTAGKLKDGKDKDGNSLTQDREKELEAARKTNEQLIKLNDEYYNAGLKLKLDTIKANEDLNTQQLEDDFKNVKLKDNANKLEKAQFEKLQNEKLQIINQSKIKFAEAQRDAIADVLKGENIDPSTNAAFNELNKKINELRKNGAKLAEEGIAANIKVKDTESDENKQRIMGIINELSEFAKNGILLDIGFNPQSVSALQESLKDVYEAFAKGPDNQKGQWEAVAKAGVAAYAVVSDFAYNREVQAIEEQRALNEEAEAAELENAEGNEQQKALIKQKYDEKERQLKRRAAENEKRKALADIKIATAKAIITAAASAPFPANLPGIAFATALGVAQYALAASQPIPKFKDGVVGFDGIVGGVGTGTSDSNLAYLSRGESVIPAEATAKNMGLIRSLVDNGDPSAYINSHYVLPAIKEAENANKRETEKRLSEMQNLIITSTISQTLKSIEKKGDVNTNKIVEAVSKKSNGFNL